MNVRVPPLRPSWMTTVGVLGIILGCFGALSASQTLLTPMMLEWQRRMYAIMEAQAAKKPESEAFFSGFGEFFGQSLVPLPAWFAPWFVVLGILSLAIAGAYLFGAIGLLLFKPSAPRIFCGALVASIATAIARTVVLILARGLLGLAMGIGGFFGLVMDVVLLLVVLAHKQEWPAALEQDSGQLRRERLSG